MKLRYMVDCVLRHDEKGQPRYEPVGVWVQGPGPGLDIEMFYIESNDPAVLARKEEANWVLNRLVEADITNLPEDFLEYHRHTQSIYDGVFGQILDSLPDTLEHTIKAIERNPDVGEVQ